MKKEPGTAASTEPLWQPPGPEVKSEQSEKAVRGFVKRPAPRTVITDSPSKRRVQGSPRRASPMAMHTGTVITQLAPGLQEVVRTALKEVLPGAIEKAMASSGNAWEERATEQATKREVEARDQVVNRRQPLQVGRHKLLPWKTGWKLPKTRRARRRQARSRTSLCWRRKLQKVTGR